MSNVLMVVMLAFKSISMTLIGVENNDTTYFNVDIQNQDTGYFIHATNTKGLNTRIYTDKLWHLLKLNKVQPGRVKMEEEWRRSYYYVKINDKEKKYKCDAPVIDRHIVGYFLATIKDCKLRKFKMLVPEKGIFPFKSRCKKEKGKKLRTLEIGGLYRMVYRKTFYFLFDANKPLLYKYWDNEKRGLILKDYHIE